MKSRDMSYRDQLLILVGWHQASRAHWIARARTSCSGARQDCCKFARDANWSMLRTQKQIRDWEASQRKWARLTRPVLLQEQAS